MTHVTRPRTTRTPPHPKNNFWPIRFLNPKFFRPQFFFADSKFFSNLKKWSLTLKTKSCFKVRKGVKWWLPGFLIQPLIGCVLYFGGWLGLFLLNDGIDHSWFALNSLLSVYFLDGCAYLKYSHWLAVYCGLDTSPASNWLFTLIWWLATPSAQPKLAAKI